MDDSNRQSDPDRPPESTSEPMSRQDWVRLPANPDANEDLGYELFDLEAHETDDDNVLIIPQDEDMLRDDAFIVIAKEDVITLGE